MNALAGRAPYGNIGGTVQVNGEVANMKHFRSNIGFVPQVMPAHKRHWEHPTMWGRGRDCELHLETSNNVGSGKGLRATLGNIQQ